MPNYINPGKILSVTAATVVCILFMLSGSGLCETANGEGTGLVAPQERQAQKAVDAQLNADERFSRMEKRLESMADTFKSSEERIYDNKMMARELIRYVKVMVGALVAIAIGFPLVIWLLSKKRILGLSGLSQEVSATLVVVEERQAKLANILKEVQGEIDYVHGMSVPDLKDLINQAEKYLKQNEQDLEKNVRDKQ